MGFEVVLAGVAALAQFAMAWLGWRVSMRPPRTYAVRRRYELGFIAAGAVGLIATLALGGLSWREQRQDHEQIVALQRANMEWCYQATKANEPPTTRRRGPQDLSAQPAF